MSCCRGRRERPWRSCRNRSGRPSCLRSCVPLSCERRLNSASAASQTLAVRRNDIAARPCGPGPRPCGLRMLRCPATRRRGGRRVDRRAEAGGLDQGHRQRRPSLSGDFQIDQTGTVLVPLAGPTKAAGMTRARGRPDQAIPRRICEGSEGHGFGSARLDPKGIIAGSMSSPGNPVPPVGGYWIARSRALIAKVCVDATGRRQTQPPLAQVRSNGMTMLQRTPSVAISSVTAPPSSWGMRSRMRLVP